MKIKFHVPNSIAFLIACGIILRVICLFLFADTRNPEMWEFGILSKNLYNGLGYSFAYYNSVVPSAIMPPGVPFIYYCFFLIFGITSFTFVLILLFNIILSAVCNLIMYFLSKNIFDERIALYSTAYFCFSPIFIYSSILFSTVVVYHFFSGILFILFIKYFNNRHISPLKSGLISGIVFGLSFYFRAEFLLLAIIIILMYIFSKQIKLAFTILIISTIVILPWSVRNYITFGKVVPVSTNSGLNFLMGHSPMVYDSIYVSFMKELPKDSQFEIEASNRSFERGVQFIASNPLFEVKEDVRKIFSLWFFDSFRRESSNIMYITIWLCTLVLFFIGLIKTFNKEELRKKLVFLYVFLIFSTFLVIIFYNVPRYQVQMSYNMVPVSMYGLYFLIQKYFKRNLQTK